MGRKKIIIEQIENTKDRMITFCKRKFGLLKKAAEISILCGVSVYLAFTDQNGNAYQFDSFDGKTSSPECESRFLLEKVRSGEVVNYDLSQYPYESLKYEHTLHEYDRQDDFMSNIERQLSFTNIETLKKRPAEFQLPEILAIRENKKDETKLQMKYNSGENLMTSKSFVNLWELFNSKSEKQKKSKDKEKNENETTTLRGLLLKINQEFTSQSIFDRNLSIPKNEGSIIDLTIFYTMIKRYLLAAADQTLPSPGQNDANDSFKVHILQISQFETIRSLIKNISFDEIIQHKESTLNVRILTEYFLRKFINPNYSISKHVSFACLNGISNLVRSYYQNISMVLSLVYSEDLDESDSQVKYSQEYLKLTEEVLDVTLRTLLTKEINRETKFDTENLLANKLMVDRSKETNNSKRPRAIISQIPVSVPINKGTIDYVVDSIKAKAVQKEWKRDIKEFLEPKNESKHRIFTGESQFIENSQSNDRKTKPQQENASIKASNPKTSNGHLPVRVNQDTSIKVKIEDEEKY